VRRRLLFLVPFAPRLDATHGGGRALAQLIGRLASRHDTALLALRADDDLPVDDLLKERCHLVEEFVRGGVGRTVRERWSRRARLLAGLAAGRPMWASEWFLPAYAKRAGGLARAWRPDIIQIEFHVMAQYARAVSSASAPIVLTEPESGVQAAEDQLRSATGFEKVLRRMDARAWHRFEKRVLGEVDAVVAFTERDRDAVTQLRPNATVARIPLGTEVPSKPLSASGSPPPSIVFVGNFMHPPNADAALRLVTEIFPLVSSRSPHSLLYIVGDRPPGEIERLSSERVIVTGIVPDVTPYLDRAAVVVAPVRFGGGMRVKVLEALAAGKAMVASKRALEGLDVVDEDQVLVAESDREFGEAISRLLLDEDLRVTLATHAREWACSNIGWEKSIEAYEALYESLLRRAARLTRTA
jgi:glycosyltransferase involved in cell wall biosynthesis